MRIREPAQACPRIGYLCLHIMLRREGWVIDKKGVVHRIYPGRRAHGAAGAPAETGKPPAGGAASAKAAE